ncbi:MAG: ThuA domain-containing protein [Candidatus Methylacidiphilales bacterium]
MKKQSALIFYGGWDGHQPKATAHLLADSLEEKGFTVQLSDTLEVLEDADLLGSVDVICPCWTMGQLQGKSSENLLRAVRSGTGLGGFHGGMGDAFRGNTNYEWMVGGHFVGHPHVGRYTVRKTRNLHSITQELPDSFEYESEQYYMLIDPSVQVLAEADYTHEGVTCSMPIVWIRPWGQGRVFYSALGHIPDEFKTFPKVWEMTVRGILWAAGRNDNN